MPDNKIKWEIAKPKKHFEKFFKSHPQHVKFLPEFKEDVTDNPFSHDTPKKIIKLQPDDNYPKDCYRWKKKDLRIVYSVSKPDKLILPLDANTAGSIAYRK